MYFFPLVTIFCVLTPSVFGDDFSYSVYGDDEDSFEIYTGRKIQTEKNSNQIVVKNQQVPVLHKNFFNIKHKLNKLIIEACNISELRGGLEETLPPLQLLSVTGNNFNVIRNGIFNHLEVKVLNLANNNIEEIETSAFDDNYALNEINLQHNKIKKIDPEWFKNSPNLYTVNLNLNEIVVVPAYALKNIAKSDNTAIISVNSNKIQEVDPKAFDGIKNIGMLDLSNNFIEVIPEGLFSNTQVFFLNLSTNRIRDYPKDELFTNVESINFDNNAFNGDFHSDLNEY